MVEEKHLVVSKENHDRIRQHSLDTGKSIKKIAEEMIVKFFGDDVIDDSGIEF